MTLALAGFALLLLLLPLFLYSGVTTANTDFSMRDLTGKGDRFLAWLNNFYAVLASPQGALLETEAPGVTSLAFQVKNAWNTAYNLATNQSTRNHYTILAARVLRYGTPQNPGGDVALLREFIATISAAVKNGSVPNALAGLAGLTPYMKRRAVPQIPLDGPNLTPEPTDPHHIAVRYSQVGKDRKSKTKPKGCRGCQITVQMADGRSMSKTFTKTPCDFDLPANMTGTPVTVFGVWNMGNSKNSPVGEIIRMGVP